MVVQPGLEYKDSFYTEVVFALLAHAIPKGIDEGPFERFIEESIGGNDFEKCRLGRVERVRDGYCALYFRKKDPHIPEVLLLEFSEFRKGIIIDKKEGVIIRLMDGTEILVKAKYPAGEIPKKHSLEDVEGFTMVHEISQLVINGSPANAAITMFFTAPGFQDQRVDVFAEICNKLVEACSENRAGKSNVREFLKGVIENIVEFSRDREISRSVQLVAAQSLTILSWMERGVPEAENMRVTADPDKMVMNDKRGKSFMHRLALPGVIKEVKTEGAPGFYWRGIEGISKLGNNVPGNLIFDKERLERAKDNVVMYVMDHGFYEVPEDLLEHTENYIISTIHETFFVNDLLPGSFQVTSTGAGHFQGTKIDIKQVTEGRGIQVNVRYNTQGDIEEIIAQELKAGDWTLALPGCVDYMINLGGLRFNDVSIDLKPVSARRFNPEFDFSEENIKKVKTAVSEKAKIAPYLVARVGDDIFLVKNAEAMLPAGSGMKDMKDKKYKFFKEKINEWDPEYRQEVLSYLDNVRGHFVSTLEKEKTDVIPSAVTGAMKIGMESRGRPTVKTIAVGDFRDPDRVYITLDTRAYLGDSEKGYSLPDNSIMGGILKIIRTVDDEFKKQGKEAFGKMHFRGLINLKTMEICMAEYWRVGYHSRVYFARNPSVGSDEWENNKGEGIAHLNATARVDDKGEVKISFEITVDDTREETRYRTKDLRWFGKLIKIIAAFQGDFDKLTIAYGASAGTPTETFTIKEFQEFLQAKVEEKIGTVQKQEQKIPGLRWIPAPENITPYDSLVSLYQNLADPEEADKLIESVRDSYERSLAVSPENIGIELLAEETLAEAKGDVPASLGKTDSIFSFIDSNAAYMAALLGKDAKEDMLIRVPLEALEAVDASSVKNYLADIQKMPHGYIELYSSEGTEEVSEDKYRKYGIEKKKLPGTFAKNRRNTITLLSVLKGQKLSAKGRLNDEWGIGDMRPTDTIISPMGLNYDSSGFVRAMIFGLRLAEIARQEDREGEVDKEFAMETLVQYRDFCMSQGVKRFDLNVTDLVDIATGNINQVIKALNRLISSLPIVPINTEEQRVIYEHAREALIRA